MGAADTQVTVVETVQAFATHRGLALRGPGGTIFLSNRQLAAVAEFAIALQDLMGRDADLESNGDELDGANSEDEFMLHSLWQGGAGCPIADPGGCEHDGWEEERGDQAMHYSIDQTRNIGPDNPVLQ
jgi:hypothetical protein